MAVAERDVSIVNEHGIHARPATQLAALANQFDSDIRVSSNSATVDAKNVLGVLSLAAPRGTKLRLRARGADATEAVEALSSLVSRGFDNLEDSYRELEPSAVASPANVGSPRSPLGSADAGAVALAADHRGYALKESIACLLDRQGFRVSDFGTNMPKSCDYPDLAFTVAQTVASGQAKWGILICGSGVGVCVAANKVPGIRAALCSDELTAHMSRRHIDANVLCLASDLLGEAAAHRIVLGFLIAEFEAGGRHERRVRKLAHIEEGRDPHECAAKDACH